MKKKTSFSSTQINDYDLKSFSDYQEVYNYSLKYPADFWSAVAERINWYQKWSSVSKFDFVKGEIKWYAGAKLNASYNCIDRHLENGHGDKIAIIWEGNDPSVSKVYSYKKLHEEVCKFSNVLKKQNIKKGDRVCIYMQMIPELAIAMLACARIGAIHSIVLEHSQVSLSKIGLMMHNVKF